VADWVGVGNGDMFLLIDVSFLESRKGKVGACLIKRFLVLLSQKAPFHIYPLIPLSFLILAGSYGYFYISPFFSPPFAGMTLYLGSRSQYLLVVIRNSTFSPFFVRTVKEWFTKRKKARVSFCVEYGRLHRC